MTALVLVLLMMGMQGKTQNLPILQEEPGAACTLRLPNGEVFHCSLPQGPITIKSLDAPAPFDVPAVREPNVDPALLRDLCYHGRTFHEWDVVRAETHNFTRWSPIIASPVSKGCEGRDWEETAVPRWTCSEKSRVLLTAEDGSKHCVDLKQRMQP